MPLGTLSGYSLSGGLLGTQRRNLTSPSSPSSSATSARLAARQAGQAYIRQYVGTSGGTDASSGLMAAIGIVRPVALTANSTGIMATYAPHHPQFVVGALIREA
jgi:hypothetical protein